MHLPKENKVTTSKGIELEFEIIPDSGTAMKKNEKWRYHSINAYIKNKDEKIKVGFVNIAYIDEEKKKEYCDNLLVFAAQIKSEYLLKPLGNKNFKDITKEEMDKMFDGHYKFMTLVDDQKQNIKMLERVMKYKHGESYKSFLDYHYMKPEIDYIDVADEHRRKGIGQELYKKATEFLGLNGLSLYQSTTQSHEAKESWKNIENNFENVKKHQVYNKKATIQERKYIDWTHLEIKPEIKIEEKTKSKKTKKIKPS